MGCVIDTLISIVLLLECKTEMNVERVTCYFHFTIFVNIVSQ